MTTSHRKQVPKDRCFRTSSSRKDFAYEPLHSEETYCVSLRHMVDVPGVQVVQIPVVVMMHLAICSLLASPGPKMLRILAGMDQKDRCSGIYMAGIACDNAPRAVFSSLVRRLFPGPPGPGSAESCGVHTGAVLGRGCVHARCWATTRPHTRGVPTGEVLSPVVAQRQIPMVSLTTEFIQLQLIDKVFDGRLCMFLGCGRGEDSRAPQF